MDKSIQIKENITAKKNNLSFFYDNLNYMAKRMDILCKMQANINEAVSSFDYEVGKKRNRMISLDGINEVNTKHLYCNRAYDKANEEVKSKFNQINKIRDEIEIEKNRVMNQIEELNYTISGLHAQIADLEREYRKSLK